MVISDQLGGLLHSRSSRGETLSAVEIGQLEAWYAVKDAQAAQLLNMPGTLTPNTGGTGKSQYYQAPPVLGAGGRFGSIGCINFLIWYQSIRQVSAENAVLRQEICQLQQALIVPQLV